MIPTNEENNVMTVLKGEQVTSTTCDLNCFLYLKREQRTIQKINKYLQASLVHAADVSPIRTAASTLNMTAATWLHVSPRL